MKRCLDRLSSPYCTLIAGITLTILGILHVIFFHTVVDIVISSRLPLLEDTAAFEYWRKPDISTMLSIYVFNVTNAQEFLETNGTVKLALAEHGPYTWSQKWEKVDVQWHPNGTVSYRQNKIFHFEPSLSYGSENDIYIFPNIPFLIALDSAKNSGRDVKRSLSSTLNTLGLEPFYERSVKDMIWGHDDPLILRLGRAILPKGNRIPSDKFGFFYGKNDTPGEIFTVLTGKKSLAELGKIIVWNGREQLDIWNHPSDIIQSNCTQNEAELEEDVIQENSTNCTRPVQLTDYCNIINGTDSTIFPSNLNNQLPLYIFLPDICRSVRLEFARETVQQTISAFRFIPAESTFGDIDTFPENSCYFANDTSWSHRGIFNVSACQLDSPIIVSWPHFLHGDPSLVAAVDGLHPDPNRHQFYLDINPKLGLPLETKQRFQINIQMNRYLDIPEAAGLNDVLIPVIWFEDGIYNLSEPIVLNLRKTLALPGMVYSTFTIGFFVFGIAFGLPALMFILANVSGASALSRRHIYSLVD